MGESSVAFASELLLVADGSKYQERSGLQSTQSITERFSFLSGTIRASGRFKTSLQQINVYTDTGVRPNSKMV